VLLVAGRLGAIPQRPAEGAGEIVVLARLPRTGAAALQSILDELRHDARFAATRFVLRPRPRIGMARLLRASEWDVVLLWPESDLAAAPELLLRLDDSVHWRTLRMVPYGPVAGPRAARLDWGKILRGQGYVLFVADPRAEPEARAAFASLLTGLPEDSIQSLMERRMRGPSGSDSARAMLANYPDATAIVALTAAEAAGRQRLPAARLAACGSIATKHPAEVRALVDLLSAPRLRDRWLQLSVGFPPEMDRGPQAWPLPSQEQLSTLDRLVARTERNGDQGIRLPEWLDAVLLIGAGLLFLVVLYQLSRAR
jgi:hypothetical protein